MDGEVRWGGYRLKCFGPAGREGKGFFFNLEKINMHLSTLIALYNLKAACTLVNFGGIFKLVSNKFCFDSEFLSTH